MISTAVVATTAEETKQPQRDLPIGMLLSLVICTVLYIAMAAVMTGLVPYKLLGTAEPVVTAVAGGIYTALLLAEPEKLAYVASLGAATLVAFAAVLVSRRVGHIRNELLG